jgi:hypothetical protein
MSRSIVYLTAEFKYLFNDKTIMHDELRICRRKQSWQISTYRQKYLPGLTEETQNVIVYKISPQVEVECDAGTLTARALRSRTQTDTPVPKPSITMFVNPFSI